MKKDLPKTLSARLQYLREKVNLSREKLAEISNIQLSTIENIEEGIDIFLSASIRQRLSRALKIPASILKDVEKHPENKQIPNEFLEKINENILKGNLDNNKCPKCNETLICKIVIMYDLEDLPVKHPKARCTKCPFQIK